jgi:arsenate reductase-like glutaredoxin family protein
MISNVKNELTLIFHSSKDNDKKARAFSASLPDYKVKVIDLKREELTETQVAEIAGQMHIPIKDLVDTTYEEVGKNDTRAKDLTDEGILTTLVENPMLLKTPIIMFSDGRCFHPPSSYDLIKEGMEVKSNPDGEV